MTSTSSTTASINSQHSNGCTDKTNHTAKTEESSSFEGSSCASLNYFGWTRRVRFAFDEDGTDLCEINFVESYRKHSHLWWEDGDLRRNKSECHRIAKKYQENDEFCNAIIRILLHGVCGNESKQDIKNFREQMKIHQDDVRGLEFHIVQASEKLAEIHNASVFEAQQEAVRRGIYGTDKGDLVISAASSQSSLPFVILAFRLAQFDTKVALRDAFKMLFGKSKSRRFLNCRTGSARGIAS